MVFEVLQGKHEQSKRQNGEPLSGTITVGENPCAEDYPIRCLMMVLEMMMSSESLLVVLVEQPAVPIPLEVERTQ
jgi:hypothetical protein